MRFPAFLKRKASPEGFAKTRALGHAKPLVGFWRRGVLDVALVTFLCFAAGTFVWMKSENANKLLQLEGCSAIVALDIESRVGSLQERLRALSVDSSLRGAFLAHSADELRAKEKWLAPFLPEAQRVRLLESSVCGGKEPETAALSYAGLDLVCEARRQRKVSLLEVHRLGSPEEHLAIAAPVLDAPGEVVLGMVHVSLPTSFLPSLGDAGLVSGRIGFQQMVAGQSVTLRSAGGSVIPLGSADHQELIPGTSLGVAAWVEGDMYDGDLLLRAVAAYIVLMALIVPAMWSSLRNLARSLAADFSGLIALVAAAASGKPQNPPPSRLAETKSVVEAVSGMLRHLRPAGAFESAASEEETPEEIEHAEAVGGALVEDLADSDLVQWTEPVPAQIFRAYDIRGTVNSDLTADLMYGIGLAVGAEAIEVGDQTVIVGRDARSSSEELSGSLVVGLRTSGCDVLDLGVVPTPLVYFATRYQGETSGAMVTAGHNPETYNGLKIVVRGDILAGDQIEGLRERLLVGSFHRGDGSYREADLVSDYIDHVERDVAIARTLRVVVDCGNGAATAVAPALYRALGCDLIELNCEPGMGFPGDRIPDPASPECLEDLQQAVVAQQADLGLAFDGAGDRLGVVDSSGKVIWCDRVLMLFAADVLSRHPGTDVVFDVKCSHHLTTEILRNGGRPVMCNSGYASLKAKLQETDALLAGEWSGHIIFRERWLGFDDALYSGARLLEILAMDPRSSAEIFAELPEAVGTPELSMHVGEGQATQIMESVLEQSAQLEGFELSTLDGLRADSETGWGLVRASNTLPALVFRFEADDEAALSQIQDQFRSLMQRAAPEQRPPF